MRLGLSGILLLSVLLTAGAGEPKAPADPAAEYDLRAGKLGAKNAKGWLELATYCEEHLLWEKRVEALRKAVAIDPENAEAHARLDEAKVGKEWIPADQAEAREAEAKQAKGLVFYGAKWLPRAEADTLRKADAKAVKWDVQVRVDTPHLRIYSARPLDVTRSLAALLESEVAAYQRLYAKPFKLPPAFPPIPVHVFADRAAFERVAAAEPWGPHPLPPETPSFFNDKRVGQKLFVGMSANDTAGDPIEMRRTAVRGLVAALDDGWAGRWNEGFADWTLFGRSDYFSHAIVGRQVLPGTLREGPRGNTLAANGAITLGIATLMSTPASEYTSNDPYARAVAWVHFLLHGEGGRHAAAFQAYLAGWPAKASQAEFEKAVGKVSELEPAFLAYLQKEFLPAIQKAE